MIGAYGITWSQRAQFNYHTASRVTGFFIRKSNWLDILSNPDSKDIVVVLKKNILLDYLTKIKMKVDLSKKRAIKEFAHRHDHELIKCITHKEVFREEHLAKQKELVTKVLEKNDLNNNSEESF